MNMNGIREVDADAVSLGMEIENDDFLGLTRGRFPFASAEGVDSGLSEDWVAPEHVGRLRGPITAIVPSIFTVPAMDILCASRDRPEQSSSPSCVLCLRARRG